MPAPAPLPDAETIRRTADAVLQRPAYQLDPQPDSGATVLELLLRLVRWIASPFVWLYHALEGLPDVLRWTIVLGLVVVLAVLIAHIAYTLVTAVRGPGRAKGLAELDPQRPPDPAGLERQAQDAAGKGDYIGAVRLLFRACLMRLEQAERRTLRAGTTNREALRRHRGSQVHEPMKRFVDTIEVKWYGQGLCGREDYDLCRQAHQAIVGNVTSGAHNRRGDDGDGGTA